MFKNLKVKVSCFLTLSAIKLFDNLMNNDETKKIIKEKINELNLYNNNNNKIEENLNEINKFEKAAIIYNEETKKLYKSYYEDNQISEKQPTVLRDCRCGNSMIKQPINFDDKNYRGNVRRINKS